MSSNIDVINAYIEAAWSNPPASSLEAIETFFSDDFQNLDNDGNVVMDKAGWSGMTQLLESAFKDFRTIYGDMHEEGDSVVVDYHFEGTHTANLDLSPLGIGVIPASGKKIVWPESTSVFGVKGGKIVSVQPVGKDDGIVAFLKPLGVKLPA